jgi:MFS family permease
MTTAQRPRQSRRPLRRVIAAVQSAAGGEEGARVVVLFAGVLALESADLGAIGAVAPQLEHAFGINHTALGLLASSSLIVGGLATLPFGWLVDRVPRLRLLAIAIVLWGVAMAFAGAAPSFWFLVLARLGLGGVMAVAGPGLASLTGDYFDPGRRAQVFGLIGAGELLGAGFGFIVCGNLGAALSWRFAFWAMVPGALALAWAVVHFLDEPARRGTSGMRLRVQEVVALVLRIRTNVRLIVASALGYFFFAGLRTFGVEFLRGHFSLATATTTLLVPVLGTGAIVGVLVGGRISDRLLEAGRADARLVVGAIAYAAATLLLVPGILVTSLLVALGFYAFAAAGLSGANPPLDAARLDVVPADLWGRAEAIRTMLRQLAQAFAPLLFGVVADVAGGRGGSGLQYAFLIMLVPLAASAALVWRGRCDYERDRDAASSRCPPPR